MAPGSRIMIAVAVAVAIAVALSAAAPASAHHVMGGEVPATIWQGLLSGLGHPIIGVDHLAFIVGVGLISHLVGLPALLPLVFLAGTVLGCVLHIQGYDLAASELAVALSVAIAAAVLALRVRIPVGLLAPLLVVAGALHGYAYGESIVGAEATPLAAYVVGFSAIQYGLAVGSGVALRMMVGRHLVAEATATRAAAAGVALVAALALANVALAG
jgi:urease accessory protein